MSIYNVLALAFLIFKSLENRYINIYISFYWKKSK